MPANRPAARAATCALGCCALGPRTTAPWSGLRVPGGRIAAAALAALGELATRFGDVTVHVSSRANLQLRALPSVDDSLPDEAVAAIIATGLLPTPTHELVRNILASPLTGLLGGRIDLRPMTDRLDAGLRDDPALAGLSGRFLFVLDDGRGDLMDRPGDLGMTALDHAAVQLRVGEDWSAVVPIEEAVDRLAELACAFADARGAGTDAPWHVRELTAP